MKTANMKTTAFAVAMSLLCGPLAAAAATCTWNNVGGTGLWSDAANWSGGAVPEPGDDVVFDGAVSQAACAANVVTNNLASLKLLNGYAGTVAFAVKAVEGAQQLSVSGALEAHSGNLVFAGDYHLPRWSPCVDKALELPWMATARDLEGNERVFGDEPDMGAYEYIAFKHGTTIVVR